MKARSFAYSLTSKEVEKVTSTCNLNQGNNFFSLRLRTQEFSKHRRGFSCCVSKSNNKCPLRRKRVG
jgi:hypothetical protein